MLLSFTTFAMFVKLTTRLWIQPPVDGELEVYGSTRSAHRAIFKAHSQPDTCAGTALYVNGSHVMNGNSAPASTELKNLSRVSSLKTQT